LFSACNAAGYIDSKKEWWPQAEAVVGFYNAYELSGDQKYLEAADGIWSYIQNHFVDHAHGEWHNELNLDNTPDASMPKAGFWKCPYHNARACFELVGRMGDHK
jgi:cellobiose epimerase